MSRPGSKRWWLDTALVTASGLTLAVWLWDGWPFVFIATETYVIGAEPTDEAHWGDYLDAGCFTAQNLRAMAEGQPTTVSCDRPGVYYIWRSDP